MKNFSDMLAEAYASWLNSLSSCCAPLSPRQGEKYSRSIEKDGDVIFRDQPGFTPPPSFRPLRQDSGVFKKERAPGKRSGSLSRGSFSVRRRFTSNASSTRRPQISAPTNFRHLHSESFHFPQHPYQQQFQSPQAQQRRTSFRPIELSIYMPEGHLSPLLPYFDYAHPDVTPPPAAHLHEGSFDSDSVTLTHERSYSSMSFHLPRRHAVDSSTSESSGDSPPRIPPRSRLRAYTSPSVERIAERIASAMIEKEILQAEIDSVIERQSIYVSSRPSTAYGMEEMEPMPDIPALPAAAPSFAERLSTERPQTAPSRPIEIPRRRTPFAEASAAFSNPLRQVTPVRSNPRINGYPVDLPLAPPLPLVLRPPLRKKKSFSRVSNWLFPGEEAGQHQRDISFDSVTNIPRPVTGKEGFYQCVAPEKTGRTSIDTVSTASTWTTEEDRTMPTTWSPGSSPVTKQDTPTPTLDRRTTFGRGANGPRPQSVGVAF